MKMSALDPRVVRTRTQLANALMALVEEESYAGLSVQDVTRRAGINRSTFYLHYSGLEELLEDCARTLFSQMRADIYARRLPDVPRDPARLQPFVEIVFRHMASHAKFYRAMLGKCGDPFFRELFQDLLAEMLFEPIALEAPYKDPDQQYGMALRFFSAGFAGIATWWLENDLPVAIELAARQISRDILPGYMRLLESER